MQSARGGPTVQCINNLKQIGLGMHNYESSSSVLPQGMRGCCWGSWLIPLLPFVEQQALFNSWNSSGNNSGLAGYGDEGMFRYAGVCNITVTSTRVSAYNCPSNSNNTQTVGISALGKNVTSQNYVVNFGNITMQQGSVNGGALVPYFVDNGVQYNFLGAPFGDVGAPYADIARGGRPGGDQRDRPVRGDPRRSEQHDDDLGGHRRPQRGQLGPRGFSHWAYAANYSGYLTPNSSKPDWMQSSGYCNYSNTRN